MKMITLVIAWLTGRFTCGGHAQEIPAKNPHVFPFPKESTSIVQKKEKRERKHEAFLFPLPFPIHNSKS